MDIKLYNFTKRKNSTLQPSNDGLTISVKLKDDTSIYTPIFLLSVQDIESYNYLEWNERYYYIDDIIKSNIFNVWEINCTIDVLATFKDDILSTSGFVLYSSSDYDIWLPDSRLSGDETPIINTVSSNIGFTDSGYFVINYLTSNNPSNLSPTGIIYLAKNQIQSLSSLLMSDGFSDFLKNIEKQLTDAKDALISCKYVPLNLTGHGAATMQLGSYTDEVLYGEKPTQTWHYRKVLTIPWIFNDFRNGKPYTALYIYLPAYGYVELNPDILLKQETLAIDLIIDGITFEGTYIIPNMGSYSCSLAQNINLGINKQDALGTLVSAVGSAGVLAGGIATGNLFGIVGGVGGLFNTAKTTLEHNLGTNGGLGGIASLFANNSGNPANKGDITLIAISHDTNVAPSTLTALYGRPLNQIKKIGNLSGYVQTTDYSVKTNAPERIKEQINNYMNGGIYIE